MQPNVSKGLPVTNPAADTAATDQDASRTSRRALLGLGAVGAVLATSRTATAAPRPQDLADFAISAELAAADLYAEADGDLWSVLSSSHQAFAEALSGLSGIPASGRDDALYDANAEAFKSGDPSAAALELENSLVATHNSLTETFDDPAALAMIASISASESRHAATIATQSGAGLDAALTNTASALSPEA